MDQCFDVADVRSLKIVKILRAKMSQQNSLSLLVSDESFRNWDSQFQEDVGSLVNSLGAEIKALVPTALNDAYLLGRKSIE